MCPQYLWVDTPHAYGRTTLKFRFLMGWVKKELGRLYWTITKEFGGKHEQSSLLSKYTPPYFIILPMRVCAPHMPDFPGEWAVPSGWIGLSCPSRSSCYIGRVLLPMWLPAYLPKFPVARWPLARWIGLSGPSKSSVV